MVGDNAERIAQVVREALGRSDAVITTGGLGPTVDDASRQGVALAVGVPTEFRPELWEQIQERFARLRPHADGEQPPAGHDSRPGRWPWRIRWARPRPSSSKPPHRS